MESIADEQWEELKNGIKEQMSEEALDPETEKQ